MLGWLVGWLVVLRIYVASAVFQPYSDLEAGDNQSLKIQVSRPGIELWSSCSASQELPLVTTRPPLLHKTFVNNKKFVHVGRLTRMAGKRNVMTCGLLLCYFTAISQQRHSLSVAACEIAAEKLFEHLFCIFSLYEKRRKRKLLFQIILLSQSLYRQKIIAKDP